MTKDREELLEFLWRNTVNDEWHYDRDEEEVADSEL